MSTLYQIQYMLGRNYWIIKIQVWSYTWHHKHVKLCNCPFLWTSSTEYNLFIFCYLLQNKIHWPKMERWLQQRHAEIHRGSEDGGIFRILGYQWRTLRFNDNTRQSTVKLMAACRESDAGHVYYMPQAHCLAVPCKLLCVSSSFLFFFFAFNNCLQSY